MRQEFLSFSSNRCTNNPLNPQLNVLQAFYIFYRFLIQFVYSLITISISKILRKFSQALAIYLNDFMECGISQSNNFKILLSVKQGLLIG